MSSGPTINVGGISGDGINNIGTNNISGGQNITNNKGGLPTQEEAVKTVCETLSKSVFAPMDSPLASDDDRIVVASEYHPLTLLDQASCYAADPSAVTADEERTFGAAWKEMLRLGGERAVQAIATVGPVAVSVIEAMVSPPFPWNLVAAGLKTAVNQFTRQPVETSE